MRPWLPAARRPRCAAACPASKQRSLHAALPLLGCLQPAGLLLEGSPQTWGSIPVTSPFHARAASCSRACCPRARTCRFAQTLFDPPSVSSPSASQVPAAGPAAQGRQPAVRRLQHPRRPAPQVVGHAVLAAARGGGRGTGRVAGERRRGPGRWGCMLAHCTACRPLHACRLRHASPRPWCARLAPALPAILCPPTLPPPAGEPLLCSGARDGARAARHLCLPVLLQRGKETGGVLCAAHACCAVLCSKGLHLRTLAALPLCCGRCRCGAERVLPAKAPPAGCWRLTLTPCLCSSLPLPRLPHLPFPLPGSADRHAG